MATLDLQGFDDLNEAFNRIANIPPAVTSKALRAMGSVAAKEIKNSGESMNIRDPESNVHILDKLKLKEPEITPDGGYADITFEGSRRRGRKSTRNAEIAFINEYGKEGQEARPFMGTAMTKKEEQIAAPGIEIIGDWIENEFEK